MGACHSSTPMAEEVQLPPRCGAPSRDAPMAVANGPHPASAGAKYAAADSSLEKDVASPGAPSATIFRNTSLSASGWDAARFSSDHCRTAIADAVDGASGVTTARPSVVRRTPSASPPVSARTQPVSARRHQRAGSLDPAMSDAELMSQLDTLLAETTVRQRAPPAAAASNFQSAAAERFKARMRAHPSSSDASRSTTDGAAAAGTQSIIAADCSAMVVAVAVGSPLLEELAEAIAADADCTTLTDEEIARFMQDPEHGEEDDDTDDAQAEEEHDAIAPSSSAAYDDVDDQSSARPALLHVSRVPLGSGARMSDVAAFPSAATSSSLLPSHPRRGAVSVLPPLKLQRALPYLTQRAPQEEINPFVIN